MRTNVVINDDLMASALKVSGLNGLLPKALFYNLSGVRRTYPYMANNDSLPKL
jgi:Arc/MetJ family transcription regulator